MITCTVKLCKETNFGKQTEEIIAKLIWKMEKL